MSFNYLKNSKVRSGTYSSIFSEGDLITCSVELQKISPSVNSVNQERFLPDPERLMNSFRVQSGSNADFFSIPSGFCPDLIKTDPTNLKHPGSESTTPTPVPGVEDIVSGGSCVES
jgi:hypothetical protein